MDSFSATSPMHLLDAEVAELSAAFEAMISEISAKVQGLADQATQASTIAMESAQKDTERASAEIQEVSRLLQLCDSFEAKVLQLEQIQLITKDLGQVVTRLETKFR